MLHFAYMLAPVSAITLTAYRVETPTGPAFVPFTVAHERTFVEPLVRFA